MQSRWREGSWKAFCDFQEAFKHRSCIYRQRRSWRQLTHPKETALVAHLGLLLRGLLLGSFVHLLVLLKDLLHRHFLVNLMVVTGVARVLHHDLVELLGAEL